MLKFYILLSHPEGFYRHFSPHYSNLSPDQTEVIINTIYPDAERDIVELCERYGVCYHVTKSNGTPARGKNELLQIFENSDNDYCVQIDGDDYLTPHGVWFYQNVASSSTPPDVICLKEQIALCKEGKIFEKSKKVVKKFFTASLDSLNYDELLKTLKELHVTEEEAKISVDYHRKYYQLQSKYCEDDDSHSRVVFMSKKATKYRFPEEFVIGEDTIFYYLLKDAHFRGELIAVCNEEAPSTYIYNQLGGEGTVWNHSKGFTDWSWMDKFNKKVEEMEKQKLLHEKDLPLIKLFYPMKGAVLDDLNTAGTYRYENCGKYINLPANASEECVNAFLKEFGRSIEK